LLHEFDIDWILSGSAVLVLYGADLTPNDLDVVPSLDPDNLRRLADLLVHLEAVPAYLPSWSATLSLDQCRTWTPRPPTAAQLDHLFVTRLGMVDVPPTLTGTYVELKPKGEPSPVGRSAGPRVCARGRAATATHPPAAEGHRAGGAVRRCPRNRAPRPHATRSRLVRDGTSRLTPGPGGAPTCTTYGDSASK
jgi:hypothetical protein